MLTSVCRTRNKVVTRVGPGRTAGYFQRLWEIDDTPRHRADEKARPSARNPETLSQGSEGRLGERCLTGRRRRPTTAPHRVARCKTPTTVARISSSTRAAVRLPLCSGHVFRTGCGCSGPALPWHSAAASPGTVRLVPGRYLFRLALTTRTVWRGRWCKRSMPAIRKPCGRARTRSAAIVHWLAVLCGVFGIDNMLDVWGS
ncbi:UNVERIFIED_ORG: hypothetical protein ABIC62_005681 [Burkholderia sp. 1595]|uniref:Uncharacterized protein n=1 Tax=Paraburkholderia terricola TaxID=169427 RepID=A0ABU1LZQ6_9BURK|nr:hypothetical protein [Paraburkholderia terricola]